MLKVSPTILWRYVKDDSPLPLAPPTPPPPEDN